MDVVSKLFVLYVFFVTCSIREIIDEKLSVVNISGVPLTAAFKRSSPPPKSTFRWGSGTIFPSGAFWYSINTELPISINRPH